MHYNEECIAPADGFGLSHRCLCGLFSGFFGFLSVALVVSDSVVASDVDSVVVVVVRNELESASRAVNDLVMEPPPCIGQTGSEELRE